MRYLVLFVMAVSLCMFSVGCGGTEKKTKKTGTEKPPVEKKTTE